MWWNYMSKILRQNFKDLNILDILRLFQKCFIKQSQELLKLKTSSDRKIALSEFKGGLSGNFRMENTQ